MPGKKNTDIFSEKRKKFNIFYYALQMLICACIWANIGSFIVANIESFPQKLIVIEFEYLDSFSFELSYIIAFLVAIISQYILLVKFKVYFYSFETDCKNPIFFLFLNIAFGAFVCYTTIECLQYSGVDQSFVTNAFVIFAFINYLIFYAKYGHEFRERDYVEDWHKNVHKPLEWLSKD